MGHGFTQRNMQKVEDERADIRKTRAVIEEVTGKPPRGWLGPGLTETWETPDLLKEEGYDYVADWVLDDQPVWLKTRTKPIVNIPYTQECNDVAMMLIQHHKASEYADRAIDQFVQIYTDAEDFGARDGAGAASLHHGCAASLEVLPARDRSDPRKTRCRVLDRRADPGLVSQGFAAGCLNVCRPHHLIDAAGAQCEHHQPVEPERNAARRRHVSERCQKILVDRIPLAVNALLLVHFEPKPAPLFGCDQ